MLACLIGLLSFQAYWISTAFEQNKKDVQADVQRALSEVSNNLLIKKLGIISGVKVTIPNIRSYTLSFSDNLSKNPDLESLSKQIKLSSESGITILGGGDSMRKVIDSNPAFRSFSNRSFSNLGGNGKVHISGNIDGEMFSNDFLFLDSLLADELRLLQLDGEDYFFGLWDEQKERFDFTNNLIKDVELDTTGGFSLRSFSLNNAGRHKLYLNFNDNRVIQASLAGVGPIVLASIIMLVLLLSAWYYIIRSLQKQYRLAQIKDDFIGNMTHELKTPVTASSLALEVMSKDQKVHEDPKLKDLLVVAQQEQKRILQIINSILDNTSAEESIKDNIEIVDVNEELEVIVESMRLTATEKQGQILFNTPEGERLNVAVNRLHFQNAMLNLLDNALKYSERPPEISVDVALRQSYVEIQITDNGLGLSIDDKKRIFDKFFRVHTGNVHTVKGYGLGLSYTKSVIEQFGGTISVESKNGEGSTFTVKIPRANES